MHRVLTIGTSGVARIRTCVCLAPEAGLFQAHQSRFRIPWCRRANSLLPPSCRHTAVTLLSAARSVAEDKGSIAGKTLAAFRTRRSVLQSLFL